MGEYLDHLHAVFATLRDARLFGNLEKCTFCTYRVSFLGFVVTPQKFSKPKWRPFRGGPSPKPSPK